MFKIKHHFYLICFLSLAVLGPLSSMARDMAVPLGKVSSEVPLEMQGVGITEHLGRKLDLGLEFVNEEGQVTTLSHYFDGKRPVLLSLVYYGCPNLCSYHLNGVTDTLKKMDWSLGQQFDMVVVSIDPSEKPELAHNKKASYLKSYGRPESAKGWHFLTGSEAAIKSLADQVGFGYRWDEQSKQWVHAAAAYIISPDGTLNRYLYGIDINDKTLRLSLVEASDNKIGTLMDRVLLFCLHYDPVGRGYSLYVYRVVRVMAALTVFITVLVLVRFWWRQRHPSL